jgi:hypothetical protein
MSQTHRACFLPSVIPIPASHSFRKPCFCWESGAPGEIRTPAFLVRSQWMKRALMLTGLGLVLCLSSAVFVPVAFGQTWTSVGPVPRFSPTAIFDDSTSRMVVFGGGEYVANGARQNFSDIWRFDTNKSVWTSVVPSGTPPAARIGHTAVYAAATNRMIIFGGGLGNSSPCANDVWVLTHAGGEGANSEWIQLNPTGPLPPGRIEHGGAYDPNTNTMMVFGGDDCFSTLFSDVWILTHADGLGGTPVWQQLNPSGSGPGPREVNGQVTYDPTSNTLIVFGGADATSFNDVWLLSNANGNGGTPVWTQLAPSGTLPAGRAFGSVVYDTANSRMIVFGGSDSNGNLLNDAWVLSNVNGTGGPSTWTQLGPFSLFPEARAYHAAVYDSSRNQMLIFGGLITSNEALVTNNVWILSDANGL